VKPLGLAQSFHSAAIAGDGIRMAAAGAMPPRTARARPSRFKLQAVVIEVSLVSSA
jgi:hypothetical protein